MRLLYSNLHQDLFNKEHKQKDERRRRTNLAKIVRSQQKFREKKIRKKARTGGAMFAAATPVLPYRHPCSVLPYWVALL